MSKYSIIEVVVGIFATIAVIALGGIMINRLTNTGGFYNRCISISAAFSDVDGLTVGSDVRIAGVRVGSVTSLRLDQDNTPIVEMCIQKHLLLPVDSSASITYSDLFGRRYVDIVPGGEDEMLSGGAFIAHTSSSTSIRKILDKVVDTALSGKF
ncbi:outer membrane lipid asymmetry maintenance protein MlaD [Anaplasma platys]|uniref:Outer membrane lipid asymmetry maintenance protein MlaD n=1 Tax=Anaplasma platys TaxID=949 RepID=A0A858PX84_9RICK|nr:outer membrane lipid asymmetry maintenance protein MlaD [Anaplasma platys]QJC27201.1 outer membrane lipid asymmetry maintenance protein MlaD [Anaplasma platys]